MAHSSKIGRTVVLTLAFLLTAVLVGTLLWILHLRGDPFRILARDISKLTVVSDSTCAAVTSSGENRIYRDLTIRSEAGDVRVTLSLPAGAASSKLPVVVLLGGLEIGRRSGDYITRHGRNAILSYEYPYSPEYWYEGSPLAEIPEIQKAVLSVPSQVLAAVTWILSQDRMDASRVSLLGYSFGAFFVPATYRLLERNGIDLAAGVMAYGGADLELVFRANLKKQGPFSRNLLARAAATALAPMEPARHLPHIEDEFLILNGRNDEIIPGGSIDLLRRSKPEPKTVIELELAHMNPRRPEVNRVVIETSREWLLEKGVIEP